MAEFTAQDVKTLRERTGGGMMDCKKALTDTDGDMEAAIELLRQKGLAKAAQREDRENNEGAVALVAEGTRAAIVQLRCETDFSAKNQAFLSLVDKLAAAVLSGGPAAAEGLQSEIDELKLTIKENIALGKVVLVEAGEGNTLDTYLHLQDGRGINAVVVEGAGVSQDKLHEVALHIAFAKPSALHRDEIAADEVEKERVSLLEITKAEGKPEAAWDKIVTGRLDAWFGERVLLEQGLFGEKTKVKESLGGGSIVRFEQAYVGA
jgi:elongation factor Ts